MKSILNLAFVLVALCSVHVIAAQNPHINPQDQDRVDVKGNFVSSGLNTIYQICVNHCDITGIGNASSVDAQLVITGTADSYCFNGGQSTKSIPGQTFTAKSGTYTFTPTSNGNVTITGVCADVTGGCKSKGGTGWSSTVDNVNITSVILYINKKPVDLTSYYLNQNQNPATK